jgi:hypothetical protein
LLDSLNLQARFDSIPVLVANRAVDGSNHLDSDDLTRRKKPVLVWKKQLNFASAGMISEVVRLALLGGTLKVFL